MDQSTSFRGQIQLDGMKPGIVEGWVQIVGLRPGVSRG